MDILIVDDDTTTLALLQRMLVREFACGVTEAENGLAALELLSSRHFDMVITDLAMPIMDGLELVEAIRNHPPLAPIPVVVMSVERQEASVRRAIELGIAAYLIKPLDAYKVTHRLRPIFDAIPVERNPPTVADAAGQRQSLAAKAPYLLVDGSPDFRYFFTAVFSPERTVLAEPTGVAGLAACLKSKPGVVFIGDNIGVLGPQLLSRKLRANLELGQPHVVRVLTGRPDTLENWEEALDGTVKRSFVPEAFREQVQRVLGQHARVSGVLMGHPTIRLDMASAAEQVFGMMMGLETEVALDSVTTLAAGAYEASQLINWDQGNERLKFTIRLDAESARIMAARMLSLEPPDVDEDMILEVAGEVSNIVTGRLKNAFDSASIAVICTLPELRRSTAVWVSDAAGGTIQVHCRDAKRSVECVMTLESIRLPNKPPAPAPPTPPALQTAS